LLHEARARERTGCMPEAVAAYEAAIAAAALAGEHPVLAEALRRLAVVRHHRGESAEAREVCRRSHAAARRAGHGGLAGGAGDAYLAGLCLVNHAKVHVARGRYEDARRNAESALAVFDQVGAESAKADAYRVLGMVYRETGRPALAEARLRSAIELAVSARALLNEAEASRELAILYQATGQNQQALTLLNAAHRLFGRLDARVELTHVDGKMAQLQATYLSLVPEWGQSP